MKARFTDQVVLITGGGGGIGRATALAFANEGARVAVAGRTEAALVETVREVEAGGGRAFAVTADVTQVGDAAALVETVVGRAGRLDIAFNNAGVLGSLAPMGELDPEAWQTVLNGNLTSAWLCMRYEIAQMRKQEGGGAIVNMASNVGAHQRLPGMGAYAATKAGVSALTRAAARDHAHEGVRVNAVSPGPIATPMSLLPGETDADRADRLRTQIPAGRVGATEEVAAAVLWLASAESGFTVGHDLVLDGGATA